MNKKLNGLLKFTGTSRVVRPISNHFSMAGIRPWIAKNLRDLEVSGAKKCLNVGSGGPMGGMVEAHPSLAVLTMDIDAGRDPQVVGDVCAMPFPDSTFDAVFMLEVLEHVKEPHAALLEVHRVLKPGGRLVMSAPFLFEIHDEPHDYFRYTRFGWQHLLRRFDDVSIKPRNGYLFTMLVPAIRLWRSPYLVDGCLGLWFMALAVVFYPLVWIVDRMVQSEAATSGYLVTAEKSEIGAC